MKTQIEIIIEEARSTKSFPEFSKIFNMAEELFPKDLKKFLERKDVA